MNFLPQQFRLQPLCVLIAATLGSLSAWAIEPFKLKDIRVEGLQRIESGTVFASLPFRVGDMYNDESGAAAIRALFALGLFKDVRLDAQGDVLVVIVEERPSISEVEWVGLKEFDKDVLVKALKEVGISEGRPFDKALADKAEQELKRQYITRSLYGAEVVTTVTPVERNRVKLTFTVTEGGPSKIKEIRITGNQAFSEDTLKDQFNLDVGGWLSWYTKSDRYSRTKLNADLETLRSYYLSRGFLEFRIDSTQVAISPDKQDISIAINVTEGDRFVVSGVKLEGNYLGKDDEFKALVKIGLGQPYNAETVAETTKAFTDYFGKFGFAFARVDARPEIDRLNNRVSFVLQAEPSRRAYVRRINVAGNNRTRDEVIRREFRQLEAAWYDGDKIKLSRDRVDRLGFFTEVNIDTQEVPATTDQVDLTINVVEKPTGSVTLGAGFSSTEKVALSFGIRQENAFGSGNYLATEINTSRYNRTIVISTTDPYYTPEGISRTVDIFHRTTRPYLGDLNAYSLVSSGAGMRFGVPFSEIDTVYFGANLEQTSIRPGTNLPNAYVEYMQQFGYTSNSLPLTVGWARDGRDSALVPTRGMLQRFNSDLSMAGDARYVRTNYQIQQYTPLTKKYTLALNADFGWGQGLSNRPYPLFKNYFVGGLGSVRGFQQSTLGPSDTTNSLYLGGPKKIVMNAEMLAPFPGAGNDRTLRLFAFTDVGRAFGEHEKISLSELRSSYGVGLSWISPMGPLRFSYAMPMRRQVTDKIQRLQFQIGTSF
ncbi:MAG: outer membrane protein assembly factor BamA [Betaproteobacteria bacterium]|jgi:outer membrane protein insertion porin family|nr:outer membrane protein assembly factor BamA [Betaproteobacteria bacterium]NBZ98048.1 outer membrane protein assembly factor BamA [Betaproteobacteria bacterium]NDB43003.1 outer membrane protein assembly factor BamA [Betaproteobacteria bacterium]NDD01112.1 outer membrane protein assembly factor BamA [Betaproteobacteria bacterium]NDD22812.1 outer membrane protein assembly factor BamA [Betaproteobacteria bacterium]